MKAKVILDCKNDLAFSLINAKFTRKFYKEKIDATGKKKKFLQMIQNFGNSFEKNFRPYIDSGQIEMNVQFYSKGGGKIIFNMEGTKEQLDEWTHIGRMDKLVLKGLKQWLEIKVER